ncbi:MAG: phospholipid/cholesterol/gamma-HCH transport system substrate-binding protein [Bradymonadia bacterium]|jgi:phospholipid/cholesterol/gamma-HCH transport system substrate-binding protein
MRKKETAIEVKVGGLVLLSIAIFAGFILVLGDYNFNPGFNVAVDFSNAAGLKPGAPVRLAGIPAGNVESVDFEGGDRPVRVVLFIEDAIREDIREDASFTITTQGVLGEPYVEITSIDATAAAITNGQVFIGTDPPRMDQLLAGGYDIINGLRELVGRLNDNQRGDAIRIDDFINNIADLASNIDERVVENSDEIDAIVSNINEVISEIADNRQTIPGILQNTESATAEFDRLGRSINRGVGDGSEIRSILNDAEEVAAIAARDAEPMMGSIRSAAESADRILSENEPQIGSTVDNVEQISGDLLAASGDVRTVIGRIEDGEGSLGRLLADEEIYEDIREFVRELKRRPWRIIWKE